VASISSSKSSSSCGFYDKAGALKEWADSRHCTSHRRSICTYFVERGGGHLRASAGPRADRVRPIRNYSCCSPKMSRTIYRQVSPSLNGILCPGVTLLADQQTVPTTTKTTTEYAGFGNLDLITFSEPTKIRKQWSSTVLLILSAFFSGPQNAERKVPGGRFPPNKHGKNVPYDRRSARHLDRGIYILVFV
jgi:hypothetical protein